MLDLATRFFRRLAEIQRLEQDILGKPAKQLIDWDQTEPPKIFADLVRTNPDPIKAFCRTALPRSSPTWRSTVKRGASRLGTLLARLKGSLSRKVDQEQGSTVQSPDPMRDLAAELYLYIKQLKSCEKRITGLLMEENRAFQSTPDREATPEESNTEQSRRVKRAVAIWEWKDERSRQMLMELMYRDPQIAADIASSGPDMVPGFITYLAEDMVDFLKTWVILHWRRQKELSKAKTGVEDAFCREGLKDPRLFATKELETSLIARPRLVKEVALLIKCAVPFNLVLYNEIQEIRQSRLSRADSPDYDAKAAILMHRIAVLRAQPADPAASKEHTDDKEGQGYD
jgi:hypothetical protein